MVATVNETPPPSPAVGDEWFDTGTTGELYVWDGQQWVSASGASDNKLEGITTDQVATNPDYPISTSDDLPELKNQLEVNRYLASKIEDIEAGGGTDSERINGGTFRTIQELAP